jgi:hypothetical protein
MVRVAAHQRLQAIFAQKFLAVVRTVLSAMVTLEETAAAEAMAQLALQIACRWCW